MVLYIAENLLLNDKSIFEMKKSLLFTLLVLMFSSAFAQQTMPNLRELQALQTVNVGNSDYHWQPVDPAGSTGMNATLIGYVEIDGVEQRSTQLEIGVFQGDVCRGGGFLSVYFPPQDRYLLFCIFYGLSGEVDTFRIYDHETETELDVSCSQTITYTDNAHIGGLSDPYLIRFFTNHPDFVFLGSETDHNWSTPGNWNTGAVPSETDNVIIDGICEMDASATVTALSVNDGKSITVMNGMTLTVTSTLTTTDASQLVVEEGGQLVHGNENVLATLRKGIVGFEGEKDHYYLVANPTASTAVANLASNAYDLFTFDPTHELEWVFQQEPAMTRNVGYLYANSGDVTLEFSGILTPSGEETIGLTYYDGTGSGRDYPGSNLVGNPFACNAYIAGSFYRMNNTELIAATGEPIAPCEGIFVEATGTGQDLTFTTAAPNVNAAIEMTLSQGRGAAIDRAILGFGNSGNLHKFMMDPNNTQIYFPQDGEKFAAYTMENAVGEMPVNFKVAQDGTYTITVSAKDASYLHLIDNMTGDDVDLMATSSAGHGSYTFSARTTDYASRFKLVFSMTGVDENMAETAFAYLSNGSLIVNDVEPGSTLQIMDALGRTVRNGQFGGSNTIGVQDLKAGVYVLRLVDGEKVMTQKIVIK